ncbi:MAG: hypothetical protein PHN69_05730 [Candidatus Pacebacteria bacterium]|nr:hypothetical protein [Candidatus Paceibacterota bacterium]
MEKEIIKLLREELDWVYDKLSEEESLRLTSTLSIMLESMLYGIFSMLVEKQIARDSEQFQETVKLFQLSKN